MRHVHPRSTSHAPSCVPAGPRKGLPLDGSVGRDPSRDGVSRLSKCPIPSFEQFCADYTDCVFTTRRWRGAPLCDQGSREQHWTHGKLCQCRTKSLRLNVAEPVWRTVVVDTALTLFAALVRHLSRRLRLRPESCVRALPSRSPSHTGPINGQASCRLTLCRHCHRVTVTGAATIDAVCLLEVYGASLPMCSSDASFASPSAQESSRHLVSEDDRTQFTDIASVPRLRPSIDHPLRRRRATIRVGRYVKTFQRKSIRSLKCFHDRNRSAPAKIREFRCYRLQIA